MARRPPRTINVVQRGRREATTSPWAPSPAPITAAGTPPSASATLAAAATTTATITIADQRVDRFGRCHCGSAAKAISRAPVRSRS